VDDRRESWRIRSYGPELVVHVETDLDIVLAHELRDVVVAAVAARRPQRVHLDIRATGELDADANRAIAVLLTMLEHRDVVVSVDETKPDTQVDAVLVAGSAGVSREAPPGMTAR
jgi:anti-anti-sigma regulatory factor